MSNRLIQWDEDQTNPFILPEYSENGVRGKIGIPVILAAFVSAVCTGGGILAIIDRAEDPIGSKAYAQERYAVVVKSVEAAKTALRGDKTEKAEQSPPPPSKNTGETSNLLIGSDAPDLKKLQVVHGIAKQAAGQVSGSIGPLDADNPRWANDDTVSREENSDFDAIRDQEMTEIRKKLAKIRERFKADDVAAELGSDGGTVGQMGKMKMLTIDNSSELAENLSEVGLGDVGSEDAGSEGTKDPIVQVVSLPTFETDNFVVARTTSSVNMRTGPGTDSLSLTVIPVGEYVTADPECSEWCRVEYDNRHGYAYHAYIQLPGEEAPRKTLTTAAATNKKAPAKRQVRTQQPAKKVTDVAANASEPPVKTPSGKMLDRTPTPDLTPWGLVMD